jgi:hypothetical protein
MQTVSNKNFNRLSLKDPPVAVAPIKDSQDIDALMWSALKLSILFQKNKKTKGAELYCEVAWNFIVIHYYLTIMGYRFFDTEFLMKYVAQWQS